MTTALAFALFVALAVGGCSTSAPTAPPAGPLAATTADGADAATAPNPRESAPPDGARGRIAARSERWIVYVPAAGDTLEAVAARLLGDAGRAWQIAEANGQRWRLQAGQPLAVPRLASPPDPAHTVTILCYHRFGNGRSRMIVSAERFEEQLAWLAREHYQVLRLSDVAAFVAGRRALPPRAVVITIDDGYESAYRIAWPALQRHGYPATLFVPSDFVGARDALSWAQIEALSRTGLIDIEAHGKTHRNLALRPAGAGAAGYRALVDLELRQPRQVFERHGITLRYLAYPYGDANNAVVDAAARQGYELGLTVEAGANPFYAAPLLLRRTMIYGDHTLEDFVVRVQGRGARP
ncbi:MAG: polysaccharide deacetylase family protein [Burkholderiales bacterium]|nr:polysaccharide deacetylase family protein [Burkholderiales bacterium]